jgi:predicted flap endonuclease-1-like 5' DNA nuclease
MFTKELNMTNIVDIEGIGKVYADKLEAAGITTVEALLERGATPKGRQELAEETGISGPLILEWVNLADLFRIKGIGEEFSDLLEEAGVDTVPELAQRNPENLHRKLIEVNEAKDLVRRVPGLSQVEDWVAQAKVLPRVVSY